METSRLDIELKEVTVDNFEDVIELELNEDQRDYVADNAFSIAESKFFPAYQPRAIYSNGKVVGFLMYQSIDDEEQPVEYEIFRFMVDRRYQKTGIGRKAMELLLNEIKSNGNVKSISICYAPTNAVAKKFYGSFGFKEVGVNSEGEIVAEIEVVEQTILALP